MTVCWVKLLSAACALFSKLKMSDIMSSTTSFIILMITGEPCWRNCGSGEWWIEEDCSPPTIEPNWRPLTLRTTLSRGEVERGDAMGRIERKTKRNVKASVTRKFMFVWLKVGVFDFWLFLSDYPPSQGSRTHGNGLWVALWHILGAVLCHTYNTYLRDWTDYESYLLDYFIDLNGRLL